MAVSSRLASIVPWLALLSSVTGCVSSGARDWGADATWHPPLASVRRAAVDAARDPHVWVPLIGAALFQIDGWDRKVSNWARNNTPVFGSQQSAADWSDHLRTASSVAYFATVLATPDPSDAHDWLRDKAQGVAVGLGAVAVTGLVTTGLKNAAGRTRPNGEGTQSFPSGHTSHSAVTTGLARDNLDDIDMSVGLRDALDVGADALTIGTAWARVEAGAHFPSDTLFSMALGSFVSRTFDRSFLESGSDRSVAWNVVPMPRGVQVQFSLRY